MRKKLQFLIPQYNEDETILKSFFDSIEVQQNIDMDEIGVIIVNDGTNVKLSQEFFDRYSFDIEYYQNEHKGVSATRNACLDKATADYVMFCDADDMFYNACGLYIIFNEMENGRFDSLFSTFIEETKNFETNEPMYINRYMDTTFVHGKIHNRKFLIKNKIRWNEDLQIHEDSYFNCLCRTLAKELRYSETSFYLWKWRDNSVCRHDEKYILKTYNNMLDSNDALVTELLNRKHRSDAEFYATSMIYDAYFTMNKDEWLNQENKEYRNMVEKRFKTYWNKYKYLHDSIPEQDKNSIIVNIKNRMFTEGVILETITFNEWITQIENL